MTEGWIRGTSEGSEGSGCSGCNGLPRGRELGPRPAVSRPCPTLEPIAAAYSVAVQRTPTGRSPFGFGNSSRTRKVPLALSTTLSTTLTVAR